MKISKPQFSVTLAIALVFVIPSVSYASTNITATSSWGNVLGWVNFGPTNGDVTVTDTGITGYAWSANYGWINLAPTNGGVVNDGNGNLSGKAWGQDTGWIEFTGVSINSSGVFTGQTASSPIAGIINFSCANCLVTTSWRPTATSTTSTSTNSSSNTTSNSSSGSYVGIPGGETSQVPYTTTASTSSNTEAQNTNSRPNTDDIPASLQGGNNSGIPTPINFYGQPYVHPTAPVPAAVA